MRRFAQGTPITDRWPRASIITPGRFLEFENSENLPKLKHVLERNQKIKIKNRKLADSMAKIEKNFAKSS